MLSVIAQHTVGLQFAHGATAVHLFYLKFPLSEFGLVYLVFIISRLLFILSFLSLGGKEGAH